MGSEEEDQAEFKAWKRAKDKSGFDEAFFQLEQALSNPSTRQSSAWMPSRAFLLLAEALIALKKRVVDE